MSLLLLLGLGWLGAALLAGPLLGGSIRRAEADATAQDVPAARGTAPASVELVGAPVDRAAHRSGDPVGVRGRFVGRGVVARVDRW